MKKACFTRISSSHEWGEASPPKGKREKEKRERGERERERERKIEGGGGGRGVAILAFFCATVHLISNPL